MSGSGESLVTIGTYDGVHLGHQRLIAFARSEAEMLGLRCVVLTFDRHPTSTLRPEAPVKLITGLDLKLELIEATGVDEVVVLEFDAERAHESPESFAADLVTDLEARVVVVGENFRFGKDHRGDVALLERLGRDLGFSARGFDLVSDEESQAVVSSRRIREQIAAGEIGEVNRFLGRPYELRGSWTPLAEGGLIVPTDDLCRPVAGTYRAVVRVPKSGRAPASVEVSVGEDGATFAPVLSAIAEEGEAVGALFLSRT